MYNGNFGITLDDKENILEITHGFAMVEATNHECTEVTYSLYSSDAKVGYIKYREGGVGVIINQAVTFALYALRDVYELAIYIRNYNELKEARKKANEEIKK